MSASSPISRRLAVTSLLVLVVCACTSSTSGGSTADGGATPDTNGGDGGSDSGVASEAGAGSCGVGFLAHEECGTADSSNAPLVQCKLSAESAPDLSGGDPPADGTYVLTDCTDYPTEAGTPDPSAARLAYKWAFVFAGTSWFGASTVCATTGSYTDKFTMTASVRPDDGFIALERTCGNGFVSGTPYRTSGNTITMNYGGTAQGELELLTFTKQ